jgi:ubiquinone/menaquinone biosynthesis C-methylase UbiE
MSVGDAYNSWSSQYETNVNRTRDLEAVSLRENLAFIPFQTCLEIGCGTGKNTEWLVTRCDHVTAVDLSQGMLDKARSKGLPNVSFICADTRKDWNFSERIFDIVVFSLVLEHISDLDDIFRKSSAVLSKGGHIYIGELHPFKQYTGSKARFETEQGTEVVECYVHHISDFLGAAAKQGLSIHALKEYFDEDDRSIPRILTLVLKKC